MDISKLGCEVISFSTLSTLYIFLRSLFIPVYDPPFVQFYGLAQVKVFFIFVYLNSTPFLFE